MKNITESTIRQQTKPINAYIAEGMIGSQENEDTFALFRKVQSGCVYEQAIGRLQTDAQGEGLESTANSSSGAYFLNENSIGSSKSTSDALVALRKAGAMDLPQFQSLDSKLKLGPGVGFVMPPNCYLGLLDSGSRNPEYALNYNAPGGTELARRGISNIIGASVYPEKESPVDPSGCFQVSGATEGLQVSIQAIKEISGDTSRVALLGPGYYAAPLAAARLGFAPYRIASKFMNPNTGFLPSPDEIQSQMTDDTKLIVVAAPNNPDGADYSQKDWEGILGGLKKKPQTRLLLDNIFGGLRFDQSTEDPCLAKAVELGVMDQIIVTGSLSKSINLPGPRIGWLATADSKMQGVINEILVDQKCNPQLTQTPILEFEGLACKVDALMKNDKKIKTPEEALRIVGVLPSSFGQREFGQMYRERQVWKQEVLKYYKGNLEVVTEMLNKSGVMVNGSPNRAGFNTFVQLNVPKGTNSMDYLSQLMMTTATYSQVSPCFGLPQKTWDQDKGLWFRISYACDRQDLIEGVQRLVAFNRFYTSNPPSQNKLQVSYDNQV